MIDYIIVEDNKFHLEKLEKLIIKYMMRNKLEFNIKSFTKETKELLSLIKHPLNNTIYIFDFELPNTNAIELSRKVRENDWISPIIVFTVNGGMALETFKQRLQILDFVSKQYEAEKNLYELFDICLKQIKLSKSLKFKINRVDYSIPFEKIKYVYRDLVERKSVIVTSEKEYKIIRNISAILQDLDSRFKCTHKACIVNMDMVEALDWKNGKIVFIDGTEVYLLSRTHKKELVG